MNELRIRLFLFPTSYTTYERRNPMYTIVTTKQQETLRIHYTLEGTGDAIVLLHGWGQNINMMEFISHHFARRFQILTLDLPGFGESEEPPHAWSLEEYTEFLHQLIEQFGLTKPILIAHSFGARIALYYAHTYPVQKMVLTGAAGIKKQRTLSYYIKVYTYKLLKRYKKKVAMGSEDFQNSSDVMRGVLVKSVEEDLRPMLKDITCETLLVWGEYDEATPLWMGELMERELHNATLIVLEGEDHFAYFHQAKRFLAILEYFL